MFFPPILKNKSRQVKKKKMIKVLLVENIKIMISTNVFNLYIKLSIFLKKIIFTTAF